MASENDTVEKLEMCPFCGGECSLGQDNGDHLGNHEYWIDCDEQGCYYRSGNAQSASEAIATHNRMARANAKLANVVKLCERFGYTIDNLALTAAGLGCEISEESAKNDKLIVDAILRAACGEGDTGSALARAVKAAKESEVRCD